MKPYTLTPRQRAAMLQTLRSRKLMLDRAIRELEAYAVASHHLPSEEHLRSAIPPNEDTPKQWLQ